MPETQKPPLHVTMWFEPLRRLRTFQPGELRLSEGPMVEFPSFLQALQQESWISTKRMAVRIWEVPLLQLRQMSEQEPVIRDEDQKKIQQNMHQNMLTSFAKLKLSGGLKAGAFCAASSSAG